MVHSKMLGRRRKEGWREKVGVLVPKEKVLPAGWG
jgi:hypothetical protein